MEELMNQEVQRTAKEKFWEEKVVRKGQWCRRKRRRLQRRLMDVVMEDIQRDDPLWRP